MHSQATAVKPWPRPGLLYAQVVKRTRRRRIVEVIHWVVIGTQAQVDAVLAPCGWQGNTAIVEMAEFELVPASGGDSVP